MLTPLVRPLLKRRAARAMAANCNVEDAQKRVVRSLIDAARSTEWGRRHYYRLVKSYREYVDAVDVTPYDVLRPLVMRMVDGEKDVLWPGLTRRFAQSSGTSDGRSKYIPVTPASLRLNHYRGASDAVAHYLAAYPDSCLFDGKAFILGGSFANEVHPASGARIGDLSANLIENINPLVNLLRVPSKRVALMEDWTAKLPALVEASVGENITNISGVPSWFLTVLKGVVERAGCSAVSEVWPRLEVFFHGGISFDPYREQYRALIGNEHMRYVETYNASEGFFAVQDDPSVRAMSLIVDAGVFYEFQDLDGSAIHPPWEVEAGKVYSLLITACNGLWRYPIGDTVMVHSTQPLRITIAGRTKHYINAFGEELMVYNADRALAEACRQHQCDVANYTAAPLFTPGDTANGCHQWLIEFNHPPRSVEAFADTLDAELQRQNSDYQAKRAGSIFLSRLKLTVASKGQFDRWLASTGKLGGQRKVPRLYNTRMFIDAILATK